MGHNCPLFFIVLFAILGIAFVTADTSLSVLPYLSTKPIELSLDLKLEEPLNDADLKWVDDLQSNWSPPRLYPLVNNFLGYVAKQFPSTFPTEVQDEILHSATFEYLDKTVIRFSFNFVTKTQHNSYSQLLFLLNTLSPSNLLTPLNAFIKSNSARELQVAELSYYQRRVPSYCFNGVLDAGKEAGVDCGAGISPDQTFSTFVCKRCEQGYSLNFKDLVASIDMSKPFVVTDATCQTDYDCITFSSCVPLNLFTDASGALVPEYSENTTTKVCSFPNPTVAPRYTTYSTFTIEEGNSSFTVPLFGVSLIALLAFIF